MQLLAKMRETKSIEVHVVNKSSELKGGMYHSDSNFLKTLYPRFEVIRPQLPFSVEYLHFDPAYKRTFVVIPCWRCPAYAVFC